MPLTRNPVQINHVPTLGKEVQVYVARLGKGVPISAIVDQTLHINGGFQGTVTIATAAAGAYTLSINGSLAGSYTATSGDTINSIRDGLRANANSNYLGSGIYAGAVGSGTFKLLGGASFTATVTGPGTGDITVGTIAAVTGGAAKGAETVDLFEPLIGQIFAGQYLCFADSDDIEKLLLVTTTGNVGDTTLTVSALDEAIPAAALAEFPTYLWDRTDASLDQTYANNKTVTFNTGGAQNAVPTTIDRKITLPGEFWHYNAAVRTAADAADAQEYVYVKRVEPAPNAAFIVGDAIEGRVLFTSAKRAGQANSPITSDLEADFSGPTKKTPPIPVAA